MSSPNIWSTMGLNLLQKGKGVRVKAEITSNLDELFRHTSYDSYVLELKKAILVMERHCPKEITTPFKGNCLVVTYSGTHLVFGSIEGRIAVVEKDTKEIIHDVLLEGGSIYAIAIYQHDSYLIAAGKDGIIRRFDFNTFEENARYEGHQKEINGLVLSEDEHTIFSASDDCTVRAWDEFDGASKILYTHDKPVLCLDRNKNGTLLISGGSDKKVKIFNIDKGIIAGVFCEFTSSVWSVKISPNNKYFAAGDSNATIKLWDFESMQVVKTLLGHTKRVSHLEFTSNENYLVSSSNDCTLRIWDIIEDKNETILTGHTDWIKSFKLSQDGKYIYSIAENYKIMTWLFPKFDTSFRRKQHTTVINSMCYSRTSNFIFTADVKEIKVWDLETKSLYKTLTNDYNISAMCLNSDKVNLIAAYSNNDVMFWNIEEKTSEVKIKHASVVKSIVVSPDCRYLVFGDSNFRVTVYSRKTFALLNVFRRHNSAVTALAFSKPVMSENDQMFSGGEDNNIYMYSISDNKSFKFFGHTAGISCLSISRTNELLISGDNSGCFKI